MQILKFSHTEHMSQELIIDIQQHVVLPVRRYVKYLINLFL